MNINLLVTTPLNFSIVPPVTIDPVTQEPLPNPPAEQAAYDAAMALGTEWEPVGDPSATRRLWAVIPQTSDLVVLRAAITKYSLPITILAAQNANRTPVVDANGAPVLDADNNPVTELVVHDPTTKATLLKYMPDVVTTDPVTGKELSRTKATTVTLPVWGGHEGWVI